LGINVIAYIFIFFLTKIGECGIIPKTGLGVRRRPAHGYRYPFYYTTGTGTLSRGTRQKEKGTGIGVPVPSRALVLILWVPVGKTV
jgi:hypothetical protein